MITEENISTENIASSATDEWDDIDFADIVGEPDASEEVQEESPAESAEADQPKPESEETIEAVAEEAEVKEEDQLFTLKYLGETREAKRDEVIALAQQGMDYKRIRDKMELYEGFLNELAGPQKISIDQLMDNTRAAMLINSEKAAGRTMDMQTALERVKFAKERKAFEAGREVEQKAKTAEQEAEEARRRDFAEFAKEYPDVNVKTIPKEVWDKVSAGKNLTAEYARYENKKLREEVAAMKKQAENAARATGSMKDAGKSGKYADFDALWDDGT